MPAYQDVFNLTGFVLEFDTSDNAATGYDAFLDNGVKPLITMLGFENPVASDEAVEDLGDHAYAYSILNETASTAGYFRYVVMHHDTYVFLAIIITGAEETSLDADALLASFAAKSGEGHSGLGEHDSEGGSTGGLWAFFPNTDPLYAGLVPDGDQVLYPAQQ